jgi:hypothetical protein
MRGCAPRLEGHRLERTKIAELPFCTPRFITPNTKGTFHACSRSEPLGSNLCSCPNARDTRASHLTAEWFGVRTSEC